MVVLDTMKWLADKLLQRGVQEQAELKEKRDRVAAYFDELAATLEQMLKDFKKGKIPRVAGNKLDVLLANFPRVLHSVYVDRSGADSQAVHTMLSELYQIAEKSRNHDIEMMAARGPPERIVPYIPSRPELLEEFERAIGKYRGLATSLRAIALE